LRAPVKLVGNFGIWVVLSMSHVVNVADLDSVCEVSGTYACFPAGDDRGGLREPNLLENIFRFITKEATD
jgi:hypothetical protein